MADYTAEIVALSKALASGVLQATYANGNSVRFGSFEELRRRLAWLEARHTGATRRPRAGFASFSRGDR